MFDNKAESILHTDIRRTASFPATLPMLKTNRIKNLLGNLAWIGAVALLLTGVGAIRVRSQSIVGETIIGQPIQARTGEAIVQIRKGADPFIVRRILGNSAALVTQFNGAPMVLRSDPALLTQKLDALARAGILQFAEPNYIARASFVPNDQLYRAYQWNLFPRGTRSGRGISGYGIQAETAWNYASGQGIIVAVIDTGVAYETRGKFLKAPDLNKTMFVPGWNFINNTPYANDDQGHGTHVTGTIAQSTNNSTGCGGVAWGASIMPLKALDSSGAGTYSNIAAAIIWAANRGANIINLSLGGPVDSPTLKSAILYAKNKNVLIVCASGNDGAKAICYPARYPECIAVGATRFDGRRAPYSNYGAELDLMAPGGDNTVDQNADGVPDGIVQMTFAGNPQQMNYYLFSGTSMAAPHVAGAAALVWSRNRAWSATTVRQALETSAFKIGSPDQYGKGLVDAYTALLWRPGK